MLNDPQNFVLIKHLKGILGIKVKPYVVCLYSAFFRKISVQIIAFIMLCFHTFAKSAIFLGSKDVLKFLTKDCWQV